MDGATRCSFFTVEREERLEIHITFRCVCFAFSSGTNWLRCSLDGSRTRFRHVWFFKLIGMKAVEEHRSVWWHTCCKQTDSSVVTFKAWAHILRNARKKKRNQYWGKLHKVGSSYFNANFRWFIIGGLEQTLNILARCTVNITCSYILFCASDSHNNTLFMTYSGCCKKFRYMWLVWLSIFRFMGTTGLILFC